MQPRSVLKVHIAFRVPRFHTNMLGWVELLENSGHTVSLLVDRAEPTEVHHSGLAFVAPLPWRRSSEHARRGPNAGAPTVSLRKWGQAAAPDILVVRDFNRVESIWALVLGIRLGLTTVLYLQNRNLNELHPLHSLAIRLFCTVNRIPIMSPVLTTGRQPRTRWTVVPFLPRSDYFRANSSDAPSEGLCLLSVGKFVQRKRHDLALQCLNNLHCSGATDTSLTVVGEASTKEHQYWYQQLIVESHALGLHRSVIVKENVAPSQMPKLLESHDVLLMLAEYEPASMIVLEALAAGLVVVVREENRVSGFVRATGSGSILLSDTPSDLEKALECALRVLRRSSRADRRRRYWSLFGRESVQSAWDELLAP